MKVRVIIAVSAARRFLGATRSAALLGVLLSFATAGHGRAQSAIPFCLGDGTDTIGNCRCGPLQNGVAGHGCENSALVGGALMTASGQSLLNADDLIFHGSGVQNSITSMPSAILIQGPVHAPHVFSADGILCIGGPLKRLYVTSAAGGFVQFPPPGSLSISQISAILGDPLTAPATRYYQIFYRDPRPLFCPEGVLPWNLSNGMIVLWR